MNAQMVLTMGQDALLTLLMVAAPVSGHRAGGGLVISLFQAITQINEATLTFIPKLIAAMLAGHCRALDAQHAGRFHPAHDRVDSRIADLTGGAWRDLDLRSPDHRLVVADPVAVSARAGRVHRGAGVFVARFSGAGQDRAGLSDRLCGAGQHAGPAGHRHQWAGSPRCRGAAGRVSAWRSDSRCG
jgi:flagellar biosynthesis protein FliQ